MLYIHPTAWMLVKTQRDTWRAQVRAVSVLCSVLSRLELELLLYLVMHYSRDGNHAVHLDAETKRGQVKLK